MGSSTRGTLVGVKKGIPPLSGRKRTDLFLGHSFLIAGTDAELIEAAKVNTEPHLGGPLLGNDYDGVQPVIGFLSLLDGFKNSSIYLLLDFILERLKVSLGNSAMSAR